jgi:hypothetical protein
MLAIGKETLNISDDITGVLTYIDLLKRKPTRSRVTFEVQFHAGSLKANVVESNVR